MVLKSLFFQTYLGIKILIKSKDFKVSLPLIFSALKTLLDMVNLILFLKKLKI